MKYQNQNMNIMDTSNKNIIIDKLNHLIKRNYDAEYGYKDAAENVEDGELKVLFKAYAEQRYQFGHDLKGEIENLGGQVKKDGTSIAGDIHRKWMDFKAAVSSQDGESMLEEGRKGEMVSWEDYNEALGLEDLPASTYILLKDHKAKIDESLYQIMELKDQSVASK
ncbi:PA2169 family four-helix-bundle protein [Fulvivirga maritima]|uniref:ferritin-like domain-containing protein n=1 Tax=Fulvivirga maritima TaxID=2904247 RepID=UPI001F1F37F6|nr:PA2169 family four-helix-bundle protein [Fulvivirga maritima]UII25208.1 PA2169 family four-helix-bundle protein [Fulvivirga maritima]